MAEQEALVDKKTEIDVTKIKSANLNNDIYTLYWASLNKEMWKKSNEELDVELSLTSSNLWEIKLNFLIFISALLFTLALIIYQVFSTEINVYCSLRITILRILLVFLVQINLFGELWESLVKWQYTRDHSEEFIEPITAQIISFFQLLIAISSYVTLLLFICTEDTPLSMIMDFTGIVVFIEIDDWIGANICAAEPNFSKKTLEYQKDKINEKLPLNMKLSKIQYATSINEDLNDGKSFRSILMLFSKYNYILMLIPLTVLLIEKLFKEYHPFVAKPNF